MFKIHFCLKMFLVTLKPFWPFIYLIVYICLFMLVIFQNYVKSHYVQIYKEGSIIVIVNCLAAISSHCKFFCYIYLYLKHVYMYFIAVIGVRVKLGCYMWNWDVICEIYTDLYCKLCYCLPILFNCYVNSRLAIYCTNVTQ